VSSAFKGTALKQARFTEAQIVDILAQAAWGNMTGKDVCGRPGVHAHPSPSAHGQLW